MIPPILNDAGDCCCQCPPNGQDGWCHCNDDYNGKGDDIENAITCDLVWTEVQANGRKKYFKVVSGSSQQNMPVVLPTASLKKRGVVQLTNELSDREDLALTPKGAKDFKSQLDKETADRIANDNEINKRIDKEIADRGSADNALAGRVTTLEENEGNHVKSVVSDSNATVTVTKQNGTKNSFTINNVAHADSATNAGHATNADNATNARHATSADSATSATTAQTATNADHATSADSATNADTATKANHATSADTATKANHATSADTATKATNADHALVADRLASGSELDTSTLLGLPNWSKYKVTTIQDSASQSSTLFTNKYTCDCNCLIELDGTTTVAPELQYKSALKVNDTTINTWDISTLSGTGENKSFLNRAFLFKKGDVISLNIDQQHNGGQTIIKLNILPLE